MPALTVRGPLPGDTPGALLPLWGAHADISVEAPALVIARGDAVAGLALAPATPAGRRIEAVQIAPGASAGAVLAALAGAFPGDRVELLARDCGADLEAAAGVAGFEFVQRQVRVRTSLAGARPPSRRPLTFRRFGAVGRGGMLAVLTSIWAGGSSPTGLSPALALEEFLAAGDTSLWRVAYHHGEPAGAMLPLRVDDDTGVLLYIGIVEPLRGRGLGAALHAEALWLLRSSGARDYRDSTTVENLAMRRLFTRAGCEEVGTSVLFVRPGPVAVDALDPPARLPLGAHVNLLEKVLIHPW